MQPYKHKIKRSHAQKPTKEARRAHFCAPNGTDTTKATKHAVSRLKTFHIEQNKHGTPAAHAPTVVPFLFVHDWWFTHSSLSKNQQGTFITFCFLVLFIVTLSRRGIYPTFSPSNFHHILFCGGYTCHLDFILCINCTRKD